MKINQKHLDKAIQDAVGPVAKKAEQEANRAADRESTLDGKVNAFAKALKRNGTEPNKKEIRKAFEEQGVE